MINLIVCIDLYGAIGKDNDLLYHIPKDMKFFKEKTEGNIVVMGYNTWESLPNKPLSKRLNIVLSDDISKARKIENNNALYLNSIPELLKWYDNYSNRDKDLYIIGGASIYNQFIEQNLIDKAYVTIVCESNKDADKHINIDLLESNLPNQKMIEEFKYNGKEVTIWELRR